MTNRNSQAQTRARWSPEGRGLVNGVTQVAREEDLTLEGEYTRQGGGMGYGTVPLKPAQSYSPTPPRNVEQNF